MALVALPARWIVIALIRRYTEELPPTRWPGRPSPRRWKLASNIFKVWSPLIAGLSTIGPSVFVYLWIGVERCLLVGDIVLQGTVMLALAGGTVWAVVAEGISLWRRVLPQYRAADGIRYHILSILFAWSNFFMAFFYFALDTGEEGTLRPSWMDTLG